MTEGPQASRATAAGWGVSGLAVRNIGAAVFLASYAIAALARAGVLDWASLGGAAYVGVIVLGIAATGFFMVVAERRPVVRGLIALGLATSPLLIQADGQ